MNRGPFKGGTMTTIINLVYSTLKKRQTQVEHTIHSKRGLYKKRKKSLN